MNHEYILGIDLAKAKLDIALRLPNGKFQSEVVSNTPDGFETLSKWLQRHGAGKVHACMEATGIYREASAEFLSDDGHTVSVINPAQIKAFESSGKTGEHEKIGTDLSQYQENAGSPAQVSAYRLPRCETKKSCCHSDRQ